MSKITNITPEEREQAIYTIGKLGEEITDERIEYYVQLHRNNIDHQGEGGGNEVKNQVTEQDEEYAKKVLAYMRRSKSDRQIALYAKKHRETLNYIKENNLDIDYTPSIFGVAIRYMEMQKLTTIHHISGEDIGNCLKDHMEELISKRDDEEKDKNRKKTYVFDEKKMALLYKMALILGVILVFAPFFITGFAFNWFWYIVIIGVAIMTLAVWGSSGKSRDDFSFVKGTVIGFLIVGCFMYLWGPLNPNYVSGGSSSGSTYSTSKEIVREIELPPCEECGSVGKRIEYADGTWSGDQRYTWAHRKLCLSCYNIRKDFNNSLKKANSPYADYGR